MKHLNWLHFTDLHTGLEAQDWLWPTFRKLLFEDLKRLDDSTVGPWDLVFFSGDLTQSATVDQFEKLSEILNDIWCFFKKLGCNPSFLSVPGNHDLFRPPSTNAVVKALRHWHQDKEIRKLFWSQDSNEYKQMIFDSFANYLSWWDTLNLPKPEHITTGLLPGDFSTVIKKADLRLGVVGLNTAFLHLTDEDYEEQLYIHGKQLLAVCNNDPDFWLGQADISILITHHGIDCLHEKGKSQFLAEVYPPGRFISHLHGHLHEPSALNFSHGGAEERRYRQGPSLFGMKTWGVNGKERIHGYTAGQFEIIDNSGIERLWPRRLVPKMGGHYRLDPDMSYDLNESNCLVSTFQIEKVRLYNPETDLAYNENDTQLPDEQVGQAKSQEHFGVITSFLENDLNEETARIRLSAVQRLKLQAEPQHLSVRQLEQAQLESHILKDHCAWLIYDWGFAKDSFIACVISRICGNTNMEVFRIFCDDVDNFDNLEQQVSKQLGLSLQEFTTYISFLGSSILVLDEIPPDLIQVGSESRNIFDRVVSSILDFCPNIHLILTSRQSQLYSDYGSVQLRPLDLSEVTNYIKKHPKAGQDLLELSVIDDLYMRSDGLPMHLDRLIETLQVASIKELVDMELDIPLYNNELMEPIPKALTQAVANLSQSTDRYTRRSFNMLKVLSVLPEGETLQAIRRVYPTEPFYPQNAMELVKLSLLKVESQTYDNTDIQTKTSAHRSKNTGDEKRLCVPRQVRDYVNSILTSEERHRIIRSSSDLLFGDKWREGKIRLSRVKTLGVRGAKSIGPGNEHSVILRLLWEAIQQKDENEIIRIVRLAVSYCTKLKENDRYKDACTATDEILSLIENLEIHEQYIDLAIIRGKSLRMIGQRDQALEILNSVLERNKGYLTKESLAGVYLSIALIYQTNRDSHEAIVAAQEVQKYTAKNSSKFMHADSIKYDFKEEPERTRLLKNLERTSRNKGYIVVANNIALNLSKENSDPNEKLVLLESVLTKPDDPYNRIRAVIDKTKLLAKVNKTKDLSQRDRQILSFAYSFLFTQRMTTLFNNCHKAIWQLLISESKLSQLLKVFRLSSFLWRIRGEESLELNCIDEIKNKDLSSLKDNKDKNTLVDINYFERRVKQISLHT